MFSIESDHRTFIILIAAVCLPHPTEAHFVVLSVSEVIGETVRLLLVHGYSRLEPAVQLRGTGDRSYKL